jgi:ubiquinone/menaquinone biosynthesis C-methylase UbiE
MTASHDRKIIDQFTRWAKPFADLPVHADADGMARTVAACALSPALTVLDVACGPGIVACALAPQAGHVTGIDLTPAMIAQARARQTALGLTNMQWHVGSAATLPFPGAAFDRVITRYSFHHMQDPGAVLAQMRRVCKPGGRIVVIDATPAPQCQAAYDRMETLRDPSHTSALTMAQLHTLGRAQGLHEVAHDSYRLEARLATLADPDDMAALTALFMADIEGGQDRMDVQPFQDAHGIGFRFPISILAWET